MARYSNWQDEFASRQRSIAEAMELIGENDLVGVTILAPPALTAALQARGKQLNRMDIRGLAPREVALYGSDGPRGEKEIEIFIGDALRPAHDAKLATYLPNTFMLGMKAFDSGRDEARMPDVFITPCSEPNQAGFVHFGPHMWQRKAYARRCPLTIAAVDPNIGPVHGNIWMHVSEIHTFVMDAIKKVDRAAMEGRVNQFSPEPDRPEMLRMLRRASDEQLELVEELYHAVPLAMLQVAMGATVVDAEAQAIADNIRQLIRDGDTIQVGVGQPSSLMFKAGAFDDAEGLGLHTELGSPGLAKLWERGILDNSRKTIHRGKAVAVAWSGCDGEDFAIIRDNPAFELYDPNYLLHPLLMAQNRQMTSINSAIAVDLLGQIASEDRFGGNMVNGTGGQPDTHISAALCPDGRAITVMRSTALEGTLTKVVAKHDAGTLVTIPRYLSDTIVTEYGVAKLLDKNHRQRAEEMISIAHPDFRGDLRAAANDLVGSL